MGRLTSDASVLMEAAIQRKLGIAEQLARCRGSGDGSPVVTPGIGGDGANRVTLRYTAGG